MNDLTDLNGNLFSDDKRLSLIGNILRNYSLDEIPQLYNVLKGEMSIIGPRPLLVEYLDLYSENQQKRHLVKPGITGLAQIKGRNSLNWKHNFMYDRFYCEHFSFLLDLKILILTAKNILLKKNINSSKGIGREKFNGN